MKKTAMVMVLLLQAVIISSSPAAEDWEFRLMPYAWFAGTSGDITVRGLEAPFDASFSDIWDNFNIGFMGRFEAWHLDWMFFLDGLYLDLDTDEQTERGKISIENRVSFVEFGLGKRLAVVPLGSGDSVPTLQFELMGGGRYSYFKGKLDFEVAGETESSQDWVDPFLGGRISLLLSEEWAIVLRGDVGGFGIGSGSDFVWNLATGIDYKISRVVSLSAGYRVLSIDYERGSGTDKRGLDMRIDGPALGLTVHF